MPIRVPIIPSLRFALFAIFSITLCFHICQVCAQHFGVLKEESLKGCVLLESPYIVEDPTKRVGFNGVAISYLERLQSDLQFDIQLELWNASWQSFIERMAECSLGPAALDPCPCDIGIGAFTKTKDREETIKFIAPFGNEAHAMVSRKSDLEPNESQTPWFVFRTFAPAVWGIIGLGVFLHAVGTIFFGPFYKFAASPRRSNESSDRGCGLYQSCSSACTIIKRFPAAILYAYSHLIGFPSEGQLGGTPSFHRTAWLVLGATAGIFLLTVYEASLTVLLFESTKESPFRTLSDITDCAIDPRGVAVIGGGASIQFWNRVVNTTNNREKCGWDLAGFPVSNLEEGFTYLKENKADYFFSLQGSVQFRANRNCADFTQVGEPFFSTSVAFVTPQRGNETLREILSRQTRFLRENDAYESAALLAARSECEDVGDATITAGRLASFFALYGIIWLFLLLYRIVFICTGKNSKKTENQAAQGQHGADININANSIPACDITGIVSHSEGRYDTDHENSIV